MRHFILGQRKHIFFFAFFLASELRVIRFMTAFVAYWEWWQIDCLVLREKKRWVGGEN